jgi:hypothetical protein
MSKELLKRVGEFLYGDQWQAPLARDMSVGERSLRRWLAGTDKIPNGVWRDLGFRLESINGDLQYLLTEVKRTSGLIEVHAFKVWDQTAGATVQALGKSTAQRIAKIGGEIIPGSAECLPPSAIDPEGRMILQAAPLRKEQRTAKELAEHDRGQNGHRRCFRDDSQ